MIRDDIIEGPLNDEEPGTYLSNLVTNKKWDTSKIRVTLDCQHQTHEPIPTTEELKHALKGSDRFSMIDVTNRYHQFEIEKSARKLFTFRTPWGIYRYKNGDGNKSCKQRNPEENNTLNIKDDILIF